MKTEKEKPHWGDTEFGQGFGLAMVVIAILGGIALIAWAMK